MAKSSEEISKEAYKKLLDNFSEEVHFQEFLEKNPTYIPTPHLLNHDVVMCAVFPKIPLSTNQCVTDFTFVTKSTVEFRFVHVEIERPNKKIFSTSNSKVSYSKDFLDAIFQVQDWQIRLEKDAQDKRFLVTFSGELPSECRLPVGML